MESAYLMVGDLVYIKENEDVSFDLLILQGTCLVSESTLTGETTPILK